ncbi:hypothetical protein DQ04_25691000, partial [Trypanosoma grayi]|uniref:hypothetical protein n=1 Tax=Trypanosoma grayi TaxID=71804 RepID=UPI0004F40643
AVAEQGREAAEAALRRLEGEMERQQQRIRELEGARHAEQGRAAAAPTANPFASMSGPSRNANPFLAEETDSSCVFASDAQVPAAAVGDAAAAAAAQLEESAALVRALEGRVAELEGELSLAGTTQGGRAEETERLSQQCAVAEQGREAAEAALRRLEGEMERQQQRIR